MITHSAGVLLGPKAQSGIVQGLSRSLLGGGVVLRHHLHDGERRIVP